MKKQNAIAKINPLFLKGIAHRGLWNEEMTENGLNAFSNAISHGVAFELDVHLSKDNHLIVIHDSDLVRTTGKRGIVEKLTLKEIKDNYRLLDGEEVPTLKEVLSLNDEKVPMVIELKHYKKNSSKLAKRLKEELKDLKDKSNFMIICFYPGPLRKTKSLGIVRQLLVSFKKQVRLAYVFRHLFESVDLDKRFFKKGKVKRYSQDHFINAWTIESIEDLNSVVDYADTITFQKIDYLQVRTALEKKNQAYLG